ncbi:MAG: hypothetical protein HGA36_04530 [Candidatus Moranbacteria bacterium]|nr:hypothetical protein [Candidatus Moranbacteria bacterium]
MLKIFGEIGEELFEISDLSFCEAVFLVNFFETATNIFEKGTSHEIRMLERFIYNFPRHEIENMLNLAEMNKVGNEILAKGIRRVRTFCR